MNGWILAAYFALLGCLGLYSLHRLQLLWLLRRHRRSLAAPATYAARFPRVTVQIPLYNEANVADRVIGAASRLDWPVDRLEIQVLDDSTDGTVAIVEAAVADARSRGLSVTHLRRERRTGFKAGALAAGLDRAQGEFLAVFDADFVPGPEFLRGLVPHFDEPRVGMIQARWEHLNRDASLLTRVQSILLDGHFAVEHAARNASGRFFNFNGTAGIWRADCIRSAGGWQSDTLTEDLDLSYRAQLAGWRFLYVPALSAPAELPEDMDAFRAQQHRWARGSAQTARKLLGRILAAPVPAPVRAEAFFHLTANAGYPLMLGLALLLPPAILLRARSGWPALLAIDLPLFLLSTASMSCFYASAQRSVGRGTRETFALMPAVVGVGIGLSISNAHAVLGGLFQTGGIFHRTPKGSNVGGSRPRTAYLTERSPGIVLETALGLYLAAGILPAVRSGLWSAIPFLALFAWGFLFTAGLTMAQRRRAAALCAATASAPDARPAPRPDRRDTA